MMKSTVLLSLALVLLLGVFAPAATADSSLRCGSHLIQGSGRHGPTMYEVLKKCGEPVERHGYVWIYKKHGKFRRLHFNGNGILIGVYRID